MADITLLREKLALIRHQQKQEQMKRKMKSSKELKGALYTKDRLDGMTYTAIGKKYGVSQQAVSRACSRYIRRLEQEGRI